MVKFVKPRKNPAYFLLEISLNASKPELWLDEHFISEMSESIAGTEPVKAIRENR
jgi:hypothetical protein